jgi:hypothetical protein
MSNAEPYIATIKHLYTLPIEANIVETLKDVSDLQYNHTWSGTFGDGNVSFSLPKKGDCIHGSAEFMCVFCEKLYGVKKTTIISSKPNYLEKRGQPSNPLLSQNATSEIHSASSKQSLEELSLNSPTESKSENLHTPHDQK